jgi:hypothetical protein
VYAVMIGVANAVYRPLAVMLNEWGECGWNGILVKCSILYQRC